MIYLLTGSIHYQVDFSISKSEKKIIWNKLNFPEIRREKQVVRAIANRLSDTKYVWGRWKLAEAWIVSLGLLKQQWLITS